ncbi:phytase [Cytophagales bacterium LB-30]|uniref:Phytase n=1 Tax=Shiella aurantiaca TaxID=3058365 RepID=A0ABT8F752_9BACT|nr:phytase [Shiella aurantiaca]MDN4165786.1 phytase [Shiella aurantiaca]
MILKKKTNLFILSSLVITAACTSQNKVDEDAVKPTIITEATPNDTDDPAIWIHPSDVSQSLIIGTDKDTNGGLYVYNLNGEIDHSRSVKGLKRPNNVDVAYGLTLNGSLVDIAVTTERESNKIRIYSLPDMKALTQDGIAVFEGETQRDPMGIALYKAPDSSIYAIVGRKEGPKEEGYLWQYLLEDDGQGAVKATVVRKFGQWSGKKEIEAIAVDNQLGFVYCSDETVGVRKYYAHPDSSNIELALFGTTGFARDHEGISIYQSTDSTGFILVSDQQANQFQIFSREGKGSNPHEHELIKVVRVSTNESDGSEVTSVPLPGFPKGLFVAMSDDKTFQLYRWEDIIGN